MTTLIDEIKAMIAERGPITVERYMQLALAHPDFGYYMNRDPFGAAGEFASSPEISQMFRVLIGVLAAALWSSYSGPKFVLLAKLEPGVDDLLSVHPLAP